ncbi:hypothetical protein AK972_0260 [Pseudomonas yamanorum]|nr:hypothetical protein AK972_0260 [Pseudomonas yamanorum]
MWVPASLCTVQPSYAAWSPTKRTAATSSCTAATCPLE